MKRSFHLFLLFLGILMIIPVQGFDIPGISSKTLKLKAKIIGENLRSLFSYQNQANAIKCYRAAETILGFGYLLMGIYNTNTKANNPVVNPFKEEIDTVYNRLGMKYSRFDRDFFKNTGIPNLNKSLTLSIPPFLSISGPADIYTCATTDKERTFLLGHEMLRIRGNYPIEQLQNNLNISILNFSPLARIMITLLGSNSLDFAFKKAEQLQCLKQRPKLLGTLQMIKDATKVTIESPLFRFFVTEYAKAYLARKMEQKIDTSTALTLDCTEGGISFFTKAIEEEKNRSWKTYLNPVVAFEGFKKTIGLSTIPSPQTRIENLKKLIKRK